MDACEECGESLRDIDAEMLDLRETPCGVTLCGNCRFDHAPCPDCVEIYGQRDYEYGVE